MRRWARESSRSRSSASAWTERMRPTRTASWLRSPPTCRPQIRARAWQAAPEALQQVPARRRFQAGGMGSQFGQGFFSGGGRGHVRLDGQRASRHVARDAGHPLSWSSSQCGGELPGHRDLSQVTVAVLQRHAGFQRPSPAKETVRGPGSLSRPLAEHSVLQAAPHGRPGTRPRAPAARAGPPRPPAGKKLTYCHPAL